MQDTGALIDRVQQRLALEPALSDDLGSVVREEADGVLGDVEVLEILRRLRHDTVGAGPLERVLQLPGVTDVVVNGPRHVWLDRGRGLEPAGINFPDDAAVRRLAVRLLAASGRRLDDAQCFGDGKLTRDDGSSLRIHAMLSPPSEEGTLVSVRVLKQSRARLQELHESGTFGCEGLDRLRTIIHERRSFLVVGGTGSGKTTLLGAMLAEADPRERIVCIEDTAELHPDHPHVLTLITRAKNTEGVGEITMADLLKQSLRMRPDRIVLGEIRGAEVVDLLSALNTGHEGCAGTIHANSLEEVLARLEALAALGGLAGEALHAQVRAAKPIILVMRKSVSGRRLAQIGELVGGSRGVEVVWESGEQR